MRMKKKFVTLVVSLLLLLIISRGAIAVRIKISGTDNIQAYDLNSTRDTNIVNYNPHDPIYIEGNSDFTEENGVTGGDGTRNNPYIIEGWEIDSSNMDGITIKKVDVYFIVRNCKIQGNNEYNGIYFTNVKNSVISNVTVSNNEYGIFIVSSSNNRISKCEIMDSESAGISFASSHNNIIENCHIIEGDYTILLVFSRNNKISHCLLCGGDPAMGLMYSRNNEILSCEITQSYNGIYLLLSLKNKIHYCNFYDNLVSRDQTFPYAVVTFYSNVDARENWWNSPEGPSNFIFQDRGEGAVNIPPMIPSRAAINYLNWLTEPNPDAGPQ